MQSLTLVYIAKAKSPKYIDLDEHTHIVPAPYQPERKAHPQRSHLSVSRRSAKRHVQPQPTQIRRFLCGFYQPRPCPYSNRHPRRARPHAQGHSPHLQGAAEGHHGQQLHQCGQQQQHQCGPVFFSVGCENFAVDWGSFCCEEG